MNGRLTLSKRYATAYLNIFDEQFDRALLERMQDAVHFLSDHQDVRAVLTLPTISSDRQRESLDAVIQYFKLPHSLVHLVNLLIEQNRIVLFPDILLQLAKLYKERHDIMTYQIMSTEKLDAQDITSITEFLSKISGKQIMSIEKIDQSLIAGIRLQSDTTLWEYSIRKQLNELEHHFTV